MVIAVFQLDVSYECFLMFIVYYTLGTLVSGVFFCHCAANVQLLLGSGFRAWLIVCMGHCLGPL